MLTLGRNGQQVFSGSSMRKEAVCETRKVFFLQSRTLSHTETATVPVPLLLRQVALVRTLIAMCNTMEPIVGNKWVSLHLFYYDDVTVRRG